MGFQPTNRARTSERGILMLIVGAPVCTLVATAVAVHSCEEPPINTWSQLDNQFSVYHDKARKVTCWVHVDGVSCLPDQPEWWSMNDEKDGDQK